MLIQIKAKGAQDASLDELLILQGNLKDLTDTNYAKLHDLILTKGFDSPIQVWEDPEGKKQILDGVQRLKTLLKLREEGHEIPLIPIDLIYADNKKDAKERLLTKVSQYGKVKEIGLDEFLTETDSIIEESFSELLDIPDFEFSEGVKPSGEPSQEPTKEQENTTHTGYSASKEVTCPSCGHQFEV